MMRPRARVAMAIASATMMAARAVLAQRGAPPRPPTTPASEAGNIPEAAPTPSVTVAIESPSPPSNVAPPVPAAVGTPPLASRLANSLPILGIAGMIFTALLVVADLWARRQIPSGVDDPVSGLVDLLSGANFPFISALATFTIWSIYLMWKVPVWQATARNVDGSLGHREVFEIENSARATYGQILSGFALLGGLLFAWQQLGSTGDTLRVSQEGQITERFTRAIDQLASDNPTVRLGGIYALERIASDSPRDYVQVMEVLTTFIRENAPLARSPATPGATPGERRVDVKAALTVIARRTEIWPDENGCLDLSETNLIGWSPHEGANLANVCFNGSNLAGAHLAHANLTRAQLIEATLTGADLDAATLIEADLTGATVRAANLSNANLTGATLQSTNLQLAQLQGTKLNRAKLFNADLTTAVLIGADLREADFAGANLTMTTLSDVDLSSATHLTQAQLDAALLDRKTKLPPGLAATPDF